MKVRINLTKKGEEDEDEGEREEKRVLSNCRPCVFHTMKDRIGVFT